MRVLNNGLRNSMNDIIVFVSVEKYFLLVKLVIMLKNVSGFLEIINDLMIKVKVKFVFKF